MNTLTDQENLIVAVATSTCFLCRLSSKSPTARVSHDDLETYVDQLIGIYNNKPDASANITVAQDVKGAMEFCIAQLQEVAADQAAKLAAALK